MPPRKRKSLVSNITPDEWNRIVSVYARHNGYSCAVAVELGWPIARTARVYKRGYPSLGLPPIKTILAQDALSADAIRAKRQELSESLPPSVEITRVEEVEVRAEIVHEAEQTRVRELLRQEEERQKARADAIKSRAEEALLISVNRRNALALNGVTERLMKGAVALSQNIEEELAKAATDEALTLSDKLQLMKSAAQIARFTSEATMLAAKSERMVLGQPIEADPVRTDGGSLEQAVEWIEAAAKAVNRARERGLLAASTEKH